MRLSILLCSFVFLVFVSPLGLASTERTKEDLSQVQSELQQTNTRFKAQQTKLSKLQKEIQAADKKIASSSKKLNKLRFDIELNKNEQIALKKEIKQLNQNKKRQQDALAAQLKSAYMTSSHDYGKLLLSQDQVASVERTLNYYTYLNQARIDKLSELKAILEELAQTQSHLEQTQLTLASLLDEQKKQQKQLVAAKKQQQSTLKQLKSQLKNTKSQLAYLKQNEQMLKSTLDELAQKAVQAAIKEVKLVGLKKQRGKLNWPSRGGLKHRFGQRKHGSFKWKGVVINAKEGTPVKSIADGQVVYADWLKGFGWVMILDHGKGYMSLYGHNQALLKEVGDKVSQGELIGLVGQSGGQSNPSLYFEIRHKGRAVNPIKWCRRI